MISQTAKHHRLSLYNYGISDNKASKTISLQLWYLGQQSIIDYRFIIMVSQTTKHHILSLYNYDISDNKAS